MIEWYCTPAQFCSGLTWVSARVGPCHVISVSMWPDQSLFGPFRRLLRAVAKHRSNATKHTEPTK